MIKELKENKNFKKRLLEIKGNYDKYFSQTALTATQYNKENNRNFGDKENKKLSKSYNNKIVKKKKLNHENLYYNSQNGNGHVEKTKDQLLRFY